MQETRNISEDELISLLRNNCEEGIGVLYDNYSSALYGIVFRIVKSEDVAQDILQETFVKVWKSFSGYDQTKGRLFTWLLNIARNKAIDHTRSLVFKKEKFRDTLSNDIKEESPFQSNVDLNSALDNLKPELRRLFELVYFEGYTHADASSYLELPLGTVKTRVRNGLIQLRKIIQ